MYFNHPAVFRKRVLAIHDESWIWLIMGLYPAYTLSVKEKAKPDLVR
jgi:hypothetical protein